MFSRASTALVVAVVAGFVGCVGERGCVDVAQVEAALARVEQRRVASARAAVSCEPWSSYPRLIDMDSVATGAGSGSSMNSCSARSPQPCRNTGTTSAAIAQPSRR